MKHATPMLSMLLLCLLAGTAAASTRLLLVAPGVEVHTDPVSGCELRRTVLVTAQDPALFDGRSTRLQSLIDSVRAILGYECPYLNEVVVRGRLKGLAGDEFGYDAAASNASDWVLRATRTLSSTGAAPESPDAVYDPRYPVLDFVMGMPLPAAVDNAERVLGGRTLVDRAEGLMVVLDGRCARDATVLSPEPGTRCLLARFTGEAEPRLQSLRVVQVVDQDQLETVGALLAERYGAPRSLATRVASPEVDLGPAARYQRFAWGERLPGEALYELEAEISASDQVTVLTLWRRDPELPPEPAEPGFSVEL